MQVGMGTKLPNSPKLSSHIVFLTSNCLRSKFLVGDQKHKTIFAINLRFHTQTYSDQVGLPSLHLCSRRIHWSIQSSADGNLSQPSMGDDERGTRLVRTIRQILLKVNTRIKELRKGLPVKILFFLVGFYCATAFATVIGQTGDWDILSAGLAVVIVEGIGALMYRASLPLLDKLKSLITMFNYWKAGLSLGLFLDAFKYEMQMVLEWFNPFNFEMDWFPVFW